jgi:hypothetical protein
MPQIVGRRVTTDGTSNDGHQQSSSVPGTLVAVGGKRSRRAARCGDLARVAAADRERARVVLVYIITMIIVII